MANLIIDIGNSYIKAAIFNGDRLLKIEHYNTTATPQLNTFIAGENVNQAIISSVKTENFDWQAGLAAKMPLIYFNRDMAAGINNYYLTPETLGIDRLAGIMGAQRLYPGAGSLVIDAGTCITYDYAAADGSYYGGSISPGLNMRFKAMNFYTAALPLITPDESFEQDIGADTQSAIKSGVQNGLKYELNGFIERYSYNHSVQHIILTGGDGIFFDRLLKNSIFAPYIKNEPYLVLHGLNAAIQQHND